jgi:possible permease
MKRENWTEQIKWGITAFLVLAATSLLFIIVTHLETINKNFNLFIQILMPIIYGAVLAYLMSPVYNFVVKTMEVLLAKLFRKKSKKQSTASSFLATICSLLFLAFIGGSLVSLLIPELTKSIYNLYTTLPDAINRSYERIQALLANYPEAREYVEDLYTEISAFFSSKPESAQTILGHLQNIAAFFRDGIWNTFTVVKNILIGLIVMVYLLNLKKTLKLQFRKLLFAIFSKEKAKSIIEELQYVHKMFGGFILGKIIDSVIIGILTFFVLSIMKMPYTLLVSVIIGVTNVVPFFGPFVGAIPCIILIMLSSPLQALYFAIAILAIQQLDGNIIGPKILGDSTGLSSFWVLFSIILFGGLFGFVGMIIAVPLWAVILNSIRRYANKRLEKKQIPNSAEYFEDLGKI